MRRGIAKRRAHENAFLLLPSLRGAFDVGEIVVPEGIELEIIGGRDQADGQGREDGGSPRGEDEEEEE